MSSSVIVFLKYTIFIWSLPRECQRGYESMNKITKPVAKTLTKTHGSSVKPIYEELRRQIISTELAPGSDIDEKSLVDAFGVSRTPVREALIRLASDGLIDMKPNRGASVSSLDLNKLRAIFEASDLMERVTVRLACLRRSEKDLQAMFEHLFAFEEAMEAKDVTEMVLANSRLHLRMAEAAGNVYFAESYRRVLADHERIAQLWYGHNIQFDEQENNELLKQQHRAIYQAVLDRDADKAVDLAMDHASLCKDGVRKILSEGESILADVDVCQLGL